MLARRVLHLACFSLLTPSARGDAEHNWTVVGHEFTAWLAGSHPRLLSTNESIVGHFISRGVVRGVVYNHEMTVTTEPYEVMQGSDVDVAGLAHGGWIVVATAADLTTLTAKTYSAGGKQEYAWEHRGATVNPHPRALVLDDGNVVLTYRTGNIAAAVFTEAGAVVREPFTLMETPAAYLSDAARFAGGFAAAAMYRDKDGAYALSVQCHDLTGHETGRARLAVRNGVLDGLSLTALAGSAGVLLAVRDGGNVTFAAVTPGCRVSDPAYVVAEPPGAESDSFSAPAVAGTPDGGWIIVWRSGAALEAGLWNAHGEAFHDAGLPLASTPTGEVAIVPAAAGSGEYVCVYGTSTAAERGLLFYYGPKQVPSAGFLEEPLEPVLLVAFVSVSVCLLSLITVGVMWTNTWNHANDDDDDDDDADDNDESEQELAGRQSGYNKLNCNTAAVEMQEELSVASPV
ncbi:hypothetical protein DIPPA_06731 [Diplonema papillatum]|nr:hypothetical protein DIPPA_06731 [Diplonema papillatum]